MLKSYFLNFVHKKYRTYYILHRFKLPPQKEVKDILIECFYWFIGVFGDWLNLIWINCLYLIAYNITINLESNKPSTWSNKIKTAWNYVFLP